MKVLTKSSTKLNAHKLAFCTIFFLQRTYTKTLIIKFLKPLGDVFALNN